MNLPWGIVASSLLNHSTGLCGALGLASRMLFSFVFIAQGSSWYLTFPSHSPFPASCCYLIPGEVDGLALEALVDSTLQQVSLKCWLVLVPVGQTHLVARGRLCLPEGSGRGRSRKPHPRESPRAL